jgi:hypothetical protein
MGLVDPDLRGTQCREAHHRWHDLPRRRLDERGRLTARSLSFFWRVLVETGEVTERWPDDQLLDPRFIDTFEQWAPR